MYIDCKMRMRGEVVGFKNEGKLDDDDKKKMAMAMEQPDNFKYSIGGGFPRPVKVVVVVGYALTSKKTTSFLQPKLQNLARNKGILFVAVDQKRPLSEQGPFDIVLHKLSGKEWRHILENACSFLLRA